MRMTLCFLCLLIFSLDRIDAEQTLTKFRCDYKYYDEIDAYLKYNEVPAGWHEARLRCNMEGSTLASPLTLPMKELMKNRAASSQVEGIFTGIHAMFSRGDLHSIEGVPLWRIPHTWAANEPDNKDDKEGCIVMTQTGDLADAPCDDTRPYVCYKKLEKSMLLGECGTIDRDYKFYEKTGSCYKFHRTPRTWSRAFMTCSAEGGYLAVINSEAEAGVMREIFARQFNPEQVGDYVRNVALLGFHDWDEHGEWRTVHGETLQEVGYSRFHPGEPNNYTKEFCGGMYRNAYLLDTWCYRRALFICEKDPTSLLCVEDTEDPGVIQPIDLPTGTE